MGYYDTKQKIVNSLLGRPDGTQIQPDNHQDFALSLLEYIRSVELISGSTLIGIADVTTVPVQSDNANECYVSACPVGAVLTYENFHGQDGNPITYSADQNSGALLLLLWNKQYWELVDFPTTIQVTAEIINYAAAIRKTYVSKEAMEADTNPFGDDGKAIVPGQLVTVVNSTDTTYNGIYARTQNGTWKFQSGFNWSLVQNIGNDANTAMSQKAVTRELNLIAVFDISAYNLTDEQPTKYADLTAALGTGGVNVPELYRRGGMTIKYIQSSDDKYVQYRLMSDTFSTTESDWQGIDDEPTAESNNLVRSSGVQTKLDTKLDKVPGENLVDPSTLTLSAFINSSGDVANGSEDYAVSDYIPVIVNGVGQNISSNALNTSYAGTYVVYNEDKNYLRHVLGEGVSNKYEYQEGDAYVRFGFVGPGLHPTMEERAELYKANYGDTLTTQTYIAYLPVNELDERVTELEEIVSNIDRIFDGGMANTVYGGSRSIDCG
jgi:hypothetical protein